MTLANISAFEFVLPLQGPFGDVRLNVLSWHREGGGGAQLVLVNIDFTVRPT